jgi:hypothetical protein
MLDAVCVCQRCRERRSAMAGRFWRSIIPWLATHAPELPVQDGLRAEIGYIHDSNTGSGMLRKHRAGSRRNRPLCASHID